MPSTSSPPPTLPTALTDTIALAIARLVDDAGAPREPSHSALAREFDRAGLVLGDPNHVAGARPVGKAKRVREVLYHALAHDVRGGERLVAALVSLLRACGGFRDASPNYVGAEAIANARAAFRAEGVDLGPDGDLRPLVLDGLAGRELTAALRAYVRRAATGARDTALLAGTGKDLVEATAAHVLTERFGTYPATANFPLLLGQAFTVLGLCADAARAATPQERVDAALYALACAANTLRNKQGTGHGRPFPPGVTDAEARTAVEAMGVVAGRRLSLL